jgi:hypothetical protein
MRLCPVKKAMVPDTVKFLFFVSAIIGAVYGSAWTLANFPPEQTEIMKVLPNTQLLGE